MDSLEELLPGIDKYLTETLGKERLSVVAERQRKYYVERLVVLQFGSVPPPNPGENGVAGTSPRVKRELPVPGVPVRPSRSNDDFIAQQRILSRQIDYTNQVPNNGEGADSDQYEDALYEEPVDNQKHESDIGSSTSYESYDECDDSYFNLTTQEKSKPDIRLPSVRGKRKKKKTSASHIKDRLYAQLDSILHEGDIYHRGKIAFTTSWTKRYCVISNGILYIYKDKESKPIISIILSGYDVVPMEEKEKGRTNVLRLARPGSETHFLSTDSPIEKQTWLNKIEAACAQAEFQTVQSEGAAQPQYHTSSSSVETAYVDYPGSVSPSLNGARRKVAGTLSSDSGGKEKKKGIGKFLSDTFGRRKGAKMGQLLISEGSTFDSKTIVSPDGTIGGIVNIVSDTCFEPETGWQYKYCVIKNGVFECYKDDSTSSDLEFSMSLNECVIQTPALEHERDLSLSICQKSGEQSFTFEPIDKLEHGDWLSALIKHVGGGSSSQPNSAQPTHASCSDEENLDYTYVDTVDAYKLDRFLKTKSGSNRPGLSQPLPSTEQDEEVERQYADLSGAESVSDNDDSSYDQPPKESFRDSKVYEDVSESVLQPTKTVSITTDFSNSPSNPTDQSNEAQSALSTNRLQTNNKLSANSSPVNSRKSESPRTGTPRPASPRPASPRTASPRTASPRAASPQTVNPQTDSTALDKKLSSPRATRKDTPTKSSLVNKTNSPSGSEAGRSFSRESSCSSEGGKRVGDSIAKSRAMFENNSTPLSTNGGKWTGFKLAGAAPVKKVTTTLPAAAASSKYGENKPNVIKNTTTKKQPTNNRISATTIGTAPGKPNSPSRTITQRTISPIRTQTKTTNQNATSSQITNQKTDDSKLTNPVPATFKTLFEAPIKTSHDAKDANISQISQIRFEVSSSDLKIVGVNPSDSSTKKPTVDITPLTTNTHKTSITTDINANITKTQAKQNISGALNKLTRAEFQRVSPKTIPSFKSPTEEQDEKRLSELRTKLTQLRQDRQKLRDKKLRTLIPEDLQKLDVEYKSVDSIYKKTSHEIKELEERKVERIKDPTDGKASIEARKQAMLENQRKSEVNSINSRRKIWES